MKTNIKFAVKLTLPDGTETICANAHDDNSESVKTWIDAGRAEAYALTVRDAYPGTRTKVIVYEKP